MASGRACLQRQVEKLSAKGEPREGLSFLFETKTLEEKVNFDLIFSSSTISEDKFFSVFYAPNNISTSRVGVSVAKRTVNKATKRNKLKRLIKSSFCFGFRPEKCIDVVVRVKHQASKPAGDKILLESLAGHWQKIMNCSTTRNTTSG